MTSITIQRKFKLGHLGVDTCPIWVSNHFFKKIMPLDKIDFSKVLNDELVYGKLMENYDRLGSEWIQHQWFWMNNVYKAFKDHYKYLIVISLVEKTLQFYDQMNIKLTYDQYYSKSYIQIEKFSISELSEKLKLPKETVRRKVLELEKLGVLKRQKKQIIIDRTAFDFVRPEKQIKITSKYVFLVSQILIKEKIYLSNLNPKVIEDAIKKNFSFAWRWFYRMQIPMIISYHGIFGDIAKFHIWGTVAMNQAFNYKKNSNNSKNLSNDQNYLIFNEGVINNKGSDNGVSAMSISDMTNIPRATVIRKCQDLVKLNYLKTNNKKQYIMTGQNTSKILPHQIIIFKEKSKFLRKVLNLLTIS
jgi:hypothetical protein